MSQQATVISVNPAKSTLGDLNPGVTARVLRRRVLEQQAESPSFKKMLNGVFALGSTRSSSRGVSVMLVRSLAGAFLLLSGLALGFGGTFPTAEVMQTGVFHATLPVIAMLIAGVSLCLGLFTRILMTGVGILSVGLLIAGALKGAWMQSEAMLAVVSFLFAVIGPGTHSLDAQIRRNLFSFHRRRVRRQAERRLSYEAFRYQNF